MITNLQVPEVPHTSCCEMERFEKRGFQLLKLGKKEISLNIKSKRVTEFLLTVRSSSIKYYTCHYGVSNKSQTFTLTSIKVLIIWKFFLYM